MCEQITYSVDYWKKEYPKRDITIQESSFAQFCLTQMERGKNLLSICCGNGRDSMFFKNNGLNVWAFDIYPIRDSIFEFKQLDLLGQEERFGYDMEFDYVYCRFVLHAVPEYIEDYILSNVRKVLKRQGKLFVETRSDKGNIKSGVNHHYRRLINFESLKQKLLNLNFRFLMLEESKGLSVYNQEDPMLIRIIADKMNIMNSVIAREMLLKMKEILDTNKISFFLLFGTLLGAYRGKAFIPYDSDVDIGLYYEDRDRVLQLVRKQVFAEKGFQFNDKGFRAFYSFDYKSEYIDLFFFRKQGALYKAEAFKLNSRHLDEGLIDIKFLGATFKTVHFIETYLRDRYGEDWRVPIIGKHAIL